jgi:hypothetical protein
MSYLVVSRRVGTPGEEYTPASEADAQRLLAGGFIRLAVKVSTDKPQKARKVKPAPEETPDHGK